MFDQSVIKQFALSLDRKSCIMYHQDKLNWKKVPINSTRSQEHIYRGDKKRENDK